MHSIDVLGDMVKQDSLWFDDGNIVLQTEDFMFKVYSGLLAARSSVFKDMLAFPPPSEGNLLFDGCPIVRVYDSTEDLRYFLSAIFDSGYFEPPPSPTQLDIVAGVLRLSTKYDVQFLRRRALHHLYVTFPSSLSSWQLRDKSRTIPPVDNTPFAALRLAREFDLLWIVPSIMYCICSHPLIKSIEGAVWQDKKVKFSERDLKVVLLGREQLLMMQNKYAHMLNVPPPGGTLETDAEHDGDNQAEQQNEKKKGKCDGGERCNLTRRKIPELLTGWTVACFLDFGPEHQQLIDLGLCGYCRKNLMRKMEEQCIAMWTCLPYMFDLADWAALEKHREKAYEC